MPAFSTNKYYPLIHWLITLVIGPLIYYLHDVLFLNVKYVFSDFEMFFLFFLFGMFSSLPVLAIYYFVFKVFSKRVTSNLLFKLILNSIIILCVFITFRILNGSLELELSIVYSIAVIIGSLFLKIRSHSYLYNPSSRSKGDT